MDTAAITALVHALPMRRARLLTVPLLVIPLLAEASLADQPVRVTTDTVEYCGHLAARLSSQPGAAQPNVQSLAAEGIKLCDTGHTRTGIAKLRRALRTVQAPAR